MHFDYPTLYSVVTFISVVAGMLLLFSWWQNRSVTALALWGVGFIAVSVGGSLLLFHDYHTNAVLMRIGPCIALAGYGLMWSGARSFEGRPWFYHWAFAGALISLVVYQLDVADAPILRVRCNSLMVAGYTLLTASEIWRARDKQLMSRWPAIVMLLAVGLLFVGRAVLAHMLPIPIAEPALPPDWFPVGAFVVLTNNFCVAFLVMNMAKERVEIQYRNAALVDPLTGAANRRAFFEQGERLLQRLRSEGKSAAVLLLDLDLFKSINDTFGHATGDRVLCAFCETAAGALRPTDVFARLGGEEFACLLPGASVREALQVAERIRAGFEGRPAAAFNLDIPSTVSVGVASALDVDGDLSALLAAADRALYDAKAKGRNRVELVRTAASALRPTAAAA